MSAERVLWQISQRVFGQCDRNLSETARRLNKHPRAWRAGASFDDAIENLMMDTGRIYNRRAVNALVNQLENRGARDEWNDFGRSPGNI